MSFRFIRQNSIRRTSPRSVSFFGTQRALAVLNAVESRELIDLFIELKNVVNKYSNYWCVIVTVVLWVMAACMIMLCCIKMIMLCCIKRF